MNFQWMAGASACPIVEFHDVRTEKFRADSYLALVERDLIPPLAAAGAVPMGQFRVAGHPERLLLVRGFASMLARRRALTDFYAGPGWTTHRRAVADLVRDSQVVLTRAVAPAEGIRPIRADTPLVALCSELRFAEQIGNYHLWLRLLLRKAGLTPLAAFATLEAVNDVPAVPVARAGTHHVALLPGGGRVPELPVELRGMLRFSPEILALEPAFALVS